MPLYEYQKQAKREIYAALNTTRRAVLMSPTGSGKTHIAMEIIKDGIKNHRRITFICDRISLIDQTFEKFISNGIDCGVIQGNHPMYRPGKLVQIASAQTLARRPMEQWLKSHLYIVDECHDQYEIVYQAMQEAPEAKFLGLSATPFTRGLGRKWGKLINTITTGELIRDGFLSPYIAYGHSQPDLKGVRTRMGDYLIGDLEERCNTIVGSVVQHYESMSQGRKALGFAVNVNHVKELTEEFKNHGFRSNYVEGRDTPERRREVLRQFRNGELDVLWSCEVMIKGMDIPDIETLILARPTRSLSLHIQMLGRGLRTAHGKDKCLILDHAGNIERLGFPDDDLPKVMCMNKKGKAELDQRQKNEPLPWNCPKCHHLVPVKTRACPCCGFIPKPKAQIENKAGILKKLESRGLAQKQRIYSQLLCHAQGHGYKKGWADHKYRAIFGVFPRKLQPTLENPTPELQSWIRSQQIRYAKRKRG